MCIEVLLSDKSFWQGRATWREVNRKQAQQLGKNLRRGRGKMSKVEVI